MRRIFIAGVPATGKTTIGSYLQANYGFRHFDAESDDANPHSTLGYLFLSNNISGFLENCGFFKDIVITWGFVCNDPASLCIIHRLQENGFQFVWFYAKQDIARQEFLKRHRETGFGDIAAFDVQMERISNLDLSDFKNPMVIETLSDQGRRMQGRNYRRNVQINS